MYNVVEEAIKHTDLSQNKTLGDIVYEAFFKTIVQGKIATGTRINEKEYARKLHISRTPVRYAMKILEHDGLVECVPKVGMVVKQITRADAVEIFAIRNALEILATTTAMEKMSDTDFDQLDKLLTLTEQVRDEGDVEQVCTLFKEFHDFIYSKSEMSRLKDITRKIQEYLTRFRGFSLQDDKRRQKAISEHRQIYHAMKSKDAELLRNIIESHLNDSLQFILKIMD